MHVVLLSHYFPPEVNAPATRTFEHARRWVRAGHRVTVVTCAPNCPAGVVFPGYRNAWRSHERCAGIDVVRVWTYLAPNRGFLRRVLNFLSYMLAATWHAARLRNVDLVVATSPQFFCGWAGVLAARLLRRPLVLEVRDLWPDSILAVGAMRRSWPVRALYWLERKLYAAARHVVTVGDNYRAELHGKGIPAAKLSVVTNGVDLAGFRPRQPREQTRAEFGLTGQFVCGYVGTVGMAHGLEVMLAAAELARRRGRDDLWFWIVGDGARRAHLQAEAARRGLTNVVFSGLVPKDRMPDVLAACDAALVHLRSTELFATVLPSKMFEIMAVGTPIVLGVRGQAHQIVRAAGAGVAMTPDDAESLLTALVAVQARGRAAFAARRYVAEHYDRDALAARMLAILQRVARGERVRDEPAAAVRLLRRRAA